MIYSSAVSHIFRNYFLYLFIFVLLPPVANAQRAEHIITGIVKQPEGNGFVYLFIKKGTESPAVLIHTPIKNGEFKLKPSYNLNGRLCAYGDIFLSADSNLSLKQVMQMYENGFRSYRSLVLEDFAIQIENSADISIAQIQGGKLNKEMDLYIAALNSNKEMAFVQQHLSSPISLLHLKAVKLLDTRTQLFYNSSPFDYKFWFNKLSLEIQNSAEGKEFHKLINN